MPFLSRIAVIGPTAIDLVGGLGLAGNVVSRTAGMAWRSHGREVAETDVGGLVKPTCAIAPFHASHAGHASAVGQARHVLAVTPSIIVADTTCTDCLSGGTVSVIEGAVRIVAIGRPPLASCLDLILAVGMALGVPDRGGALHQHRVARMLALRMHVARYLVRTSGARRPVVIAARSDGGEWRVHDDVRAHEVVDAGGGMTAGTPGALLDPATVQALRPDIILAGTDGRDTGDTVSRARAIGLYRGVTDAQSWHADWDALLGSSGPFVVDAVEAAIRATLPAALGANGTPPRPDLLKRITPGDD